MAPSKKRFVNHPGAKEAKNTEYVPSDDKNLVMRGFPLVVAATLASNLAYLQRYLWANAGFGTIKHIKELDQVNWRFHPTVIPLGEGEPTPSPLLHAESSLERQPADLRGRYYSVADYHALYRTGELTPVQVVEALLPMVRRDQKPPSRYESAWTHCHPEKALAAARASAERWAAGKPLSVLDGVPVGVKDDVDVEGYISSMGMKVDTSNPWFSPAEETVWPVQKLEEAGALVIGKNNMHELGMDTTGCNPAWGTATNWHNQSYYPGGSTSGGASAACAGIVPIAVGTDAGGSLRIPTAFTGVYGLKVSQDRTAEMNSTMVVIGPVAATARDLAIAYRVMAQPNPSAPVQGLFAPSQPPTASSKRTIGICREWFDRADADVVAVCDKAIRHLRDELGYEVIDIKIPYLREGQLAHGATCLAEAADNAMGRTSNRVDWLSSMNYPNKVLAAVGAQSSAVDYLKYGQLRQVLMQHMAHLFETHPDLLVVTPTTGMAGWKVHPGDQRYGFSDGNAQIRCMLYVWLSNSTGCPSVSCPVGYVEPAQGEGGLPVGLHAMAEWGAEEQLLAFAEETESYLNHVWPGGRVRPAGWADVVELARGGKSGS